MPSNFNHVFSDDLAQPALTNADPASIPYSTNEDGARAYQLALVEERMRLASLDANPFVMSNASIQGSTLSLGNAHLTVGNGVISGRAAATPRSNNLDVHPRHGGTVPQEVKEAAHLLRHWMMANDCEQYEGVALAKTLATRFPDPAVKIEAEARRQAQVYRDLAQASDMMERQDRARPMANDSAAYRHWVQQEMSRAASIDPLVTASRVDPAAAWPFTSSPEPRRVEPNPPAPIANTIANTTTSRPHRWGQPDRNGLCRCLACYSFASARTALPATGCSGMTPQEQRARDQNPR